MNKEYHVCLITNDESDANLILKQLDKLDIEAKLRTISQKQQLVKKLGQSPPDLIISDYNLSEFTGMEALKIVRAKFPNLPFIFISEPVGEEKAVDAILQGASDFTRKENLDRLGKAVIREILDYEKQKSMDRAYQIADIGHWELDVNDKNLFWSNAVKELHEVDESFEPDIDSAFNFYQEGHHRETIKQRISKAIKTGEPFDVELKIISAENNERWVRIAGETEFRNGKCVRVYGSTQNITQRKNIEQKLREVVEYSTNMFYRHGTDNVLTYVSPQSKEFLGYSPEEAKQKWMEFVTDHPVNKIGYEFTQKAIETGEAQPNFELQLQKKNGKKIWVQVNEAPIIENGETVAIVGSLTDITEQKEAEQQLKKTNKNLKTAKQIARLGYWELDLETEEIYWSEQTYQMWGFDPGQGDITFNDIIKRMHPEDRGYFIEQNRRMLDDHIPLNLEHRIQLPDGSVKWFNLLGNLRKTPEGTPESMEGTVQDITEKKELEILLNQTAGLAMVGSWELSLSDGEESNMYWSEMTREILEVNEGRNLTWAESLEFYEPESKKIIQNAVEKAKKNNVPFDEELLITTPKGTERWIRCIGKPEFLDGNCIRLYGSFQNIHNRKVSELELTQRKEFIETTLDNLPIGISVNTIDEGKPIFMNRQFSEIYGWPKKDLRDVETFFEKVYPDEEYRQKIRKRVTSDIESGNPSRMRWDNIQTTTKEGEKRIVNCKNIPLSDHNQMISTVVDVTAEKEAQKEKTRILNRIGDAFFAVDNNWIVTYWNSTAEEILSMPRENILGQNLWEVYDDAVELDFYTQYHRAVEKQVTVHFEEYYPGVEKWFEVSAYPSETGLSVFFQDVTERKKANQRLQELNEELEERAEELAASNAELEQFAYVASHDLQEPLRMVSSFLSRLEERYSDQLDEKAHQYINFAVNGARRMRQIILDLLNYSRVGQNEIERQDVNLNELLTEIKKLEHAPIEDSGATVTWEDLPVIEGGETSVQQVFQNLISNAIKYRKPGIKPKIHIKSEETNSCWQFSVSDNGIGIKEEFQENIFTIFKRLHTQEEYSGTGIGLAVSKKIVERHGGQIWVESEENEGSTFYFTIAKSDE